MVNFRDAVRRAAKMLGGQERLAAAAECSQPEVSRLCTVAKSISPNIAVAIVRATAHCDKPVRISELLHPDVIDAVRREVAPRARRSTSSAAAAR